jgi:hypothetical protein
LRFYSGFCGGFFGGFCGGIESIFRSITVALLYKLIKKPPNAIKFSFD